MQCLTVSFSFRGSCLYGVFMAEIVVLKIKIKSFLFGFDLAQFWSIIAIVFNLLTFVVLPFSHILFTLLWHFSHSRHVFYGFILLA